MSTAGIASPRSGTSAVTPERLLTFLNLEHSVKMWIEETLKIPLRGGTLI